MYTNGNKGSHDLEMTSERLAGIRKKEEEDACAVIGIKPESVEKTRLAIETDLARNYNPVCND